MRCRGSFRAYPSFFFLFAAFCIASLAACGPSSPDFGDDIPDDSQNLESASSNPWEWRDVYIGRGKAGFIAIDNQGQPAIAYYDHSVGVNGKLKYFYRNGTAWNTEVTDFVSNNSERIWNTVSLAIGGDARVHIAYDMDYQNAHPIGYALKDPGGWSHQYLFYGWGGWCVSQAVDSSNSLHVIYQNNTAGKLEHKWWMNGVATQETLQGIAGDAGLAIDGLDQLHIIYSTASGAVYNAKYGFKNSSGWTLETVETSSSGISFWTQSVAAQDRRVHLVYGRKEPATNKYQLRHAFKDEGGAFVIETIAESTDAQFQYPAMAVGSQETLHVAYYYGTDIRYAIFSGGQWKIETIATGQTPAEASLSIAVDSGGSPHIEYDTEFFVFYVTPYPQAVYSNPPSSPQISESTCRKDRYSDLSIECSGAKEMILSEDPAFSGAKWESCWLYRPHFLSPGDENKTIYAKFRGDDPARESAVVSAVSTHCGPAAFIDSGPHFLNFGSSATFSGHGQVVNGSIATYEWKLDGAVSSNSNTITVSGLSIGIHSIEFSVTTNDGSKSPVVSQKLIVASNDLKPIKLDETYQYLYSRMQGIVPQLIESYAPPYAPSTAGQAFVYDNALVVIALLARGEPDDLFMAKAIVKKLIELNARDNPIREAYDAGSSVIARNLIYTGNLAWTIISLAHYFKYSGDRDLNFMNEVKSAAFSIGEFIEGRCRAPDGGYRMFAYAAKSTEHNIDLVAAFRLLASMTGTATQESIMIERADWAKAFAMSMWNGNYFRVGNTSSVPVEDVQSWAMLALEETSASDRSRMLRWLENTIATSVDNFVGFDFDSDKDGVWFEGTAHAALAYQLAGDMDSQEILLNELRRAELSAQNANPYSLVAASHWGVSTSLGWQYFSSPHVGATAWYLCAEQQYNMFWGKPTVDSDDDGISDFMDNCPNILNPDQLDRDGDDIGAVCDSNDIPVRNVVSQPDFDGDGRSDLVQWTNPSAGSGHSGTWKLDLSSKAGGGNPPSGSVLDNFGAWDIEISFPPISGQWVVPYVDDINGDGRADFVVYDKEHGKWHIAFTDANLIERGTWHGWDWTIDYSGQWVDDRKVDPKESNYSRPAIGDYNGDEIADIAIACSDGFWRIDYGGPNRSNYGSFDQVIRYLSADQLALAPGWAYLTTGADIAKEKLTYINYKVPDGLPEAGRLVSVSPLDPATDIIAGAHVPHIFGGNDNILMIGKFDGANHEAGLGIKDESGHWPISSAVFGIWRDLVEEVPAAVYGDSSCHPVVGDFDGDGKSDRAVMCPDEWRIVYSNPDKFAGQLDTDGVRRVSLGREAHVFALPGRSYAGGVSYEYTKSIIELFQQIYPAAPPPITVDMVSVETQ